MMEKNGRIELSEAMRDPEQAKQIEAFIRYAEKTPYSKMFPKKYEMGIERIILQYTGQLFEEQPNLPLKNVVSTVLNSLKEDLSAELLVKMTKVIVEKWASVSAKVYTQNNVEELV
jgi:hypothetical protein